MDVKRIRNKVGKFIRDHQSTFEQIPKQETALLELASLTACVEHYRIYGYHTSAKNLQHGQFKIKTSAAGYPTNFSYFVAQGDGLYYEIHANLPVYSAHNDGGIYVVDVGVIDIAIARHEDNKRPKVWNVENKNLVTFIETKKLVIFPMLLAQFFGIVHEIKPRFVDGRRRPRNFIKNRHFAPALLATGYPSKTSDKIIEGFANRDKKLNIVPTFEFRVVRASRGSHVMSESIFSK